MSKVLNEQNTEMNEMLAYMDEINAALESKEVVNVTVLKEFKGGVIAAYKEVSGFIPMSQLADHYVENAEEFIGKTLPVKVTRVDQRRNKAVFSHKAFLTEEKHKRIAERAHVLRNKEREYTSEIYMNDERNSSDKELSRYETVLTLELEKAEAKE